VTTARDARGRFVRVEEPPPIVLRRRRQVRMPDGWVGLLTRSGAVGGGARFSDRNVGVSDVRESLWTFLRQTVPALVCDSAGGGDLDG